MPLDFPASPAINQKFPASPLADVPTYTWDGEKWQLLSGGVGGGDVIVGGSAYPSDALPLMNATAAPGVGPKFSREDHVHPKDNTIPVAATAAEFIGNTAPAKMLTSGAVWTAAAPIGLGVGTAFTLNFAAGVDFVFIMNGATSLPNPTGAKLGQKGLIYVCQDSAGGRLITSYGTMWKFPGRIKPVLTATPSSVDVISYAVVDANQIFCAVQKDFG